ncbi:type IV secretory pathway TrbL component [Cryobacterium sp. CAN_C3]|uniref:YtxH domain-containing protein n=1 Tax=unclassified Cryobacterium TaxID=2649013 RepID=UPI0018CBC30D|nr:YtxH domain-containing protein [Cryobacterium sp. CAN_C3]MEC5154248.1 type IV secretory pathway TrbL component [Cryobacterium sp. CAN_C3]
MRGKLLFITGGLVGYVLGARAGRKRYDQIAAAANDLWNAKPVQRRVTEVRDAALELVGDVPSTLYKAGKKAVNQAVAKKKQAARPAATPAKANATPSKANTTASRPTAAKTKPKTAPRAKPAAGLDESGTP